MTPEVEKRVTVEEALATLRAALQFLEDLAGPGAPRWFRDGGIALYSLTEAVSALEERLSQAEEQNAALKEANRIADALSIGKWQELEERERRMDEARSAPSTSSWSWPDD